MTTFDLTIREGDGRATAVAFTPERIYNLGSATVDSAAAVPHQNEVADVGVRIALDIPAPRVYPMAVPSITTDTSIGVHHARTSGEAEIVLIVHGSELYVGIGSDHTDRDLERLSIIWSKQYCPSVLCADVWRWSDVEQDWEELILESTVDGRPYQSSKAAVFRRPTDILAALGERVPELPADYLVYCGTYTTIANTIEFGTTWTVTLTNPRTGTDLALAYDVVDLLAEIPPKFRVPLRPQES